MKRQFGIVGLVGYGAALQASNMLAQLLIAAILTRELGLNAFGQYVLIIATITLIGVITVFGLPTYLTREIAASQSLLSNKNSEFSPHQFVRNALTTSVIIFLILAILLTSLSGIVALPSGLIGFAPISIILGRSILEINAGALAGLGKIQQSQTTSLLLLNTPFLLLLAFFYYIPVLSMSIERVLILQALGTWFGASISSVWTWSENPKTEKKYLPFHFWLFELRSCVSLAFVNGLASLQQNVVLLIIGAFLSTADVGMFRIAQRASGISQFFRSALQTIIQPKIAYHWRSGTLQNLVESIRKLSLANFSFNFFLLIIFYFVGRDTLSVVFGEKAVVALPALLILMTGFTCASIFGFSGMLLSMTSNAGQLLKVLVSTLAVLIFLLVISVPLAGVSGAVVAVAAYTILTSYLLWRKARKMLGVDASLMPNRNH